MMRNCFLPLVVLCLALLVHDDAQADFGETDVAGGRLVFRGFGTLGIARSSTDDAQYVRDLSQPGGVSRSWSAKLDTVGGIQANWQASDSVEAVAQVVSRYHSSWNFNPELTWAFVKFEQSPNLTWRAGRLGTEFYMLADSRLVGYSYLPIRPPTDYYGGLPFSYIDGGDAQVTVPLGGGLLRGKVFAGLTREKAPLAYRLWDLNNSRMKGGHVDYQIGPWQARLGYTEIRFNKDLPEPIATLRSALSGAGRGVVAEALSVAGKLSRFHSAGLVYDEGPLQVQMMLSRTAQQSALFEEAKGGYAIAGYRIGQFTPFLGYSWTRSTPNRLATGIAVLDGQVAAAMADSHSDQHTTIAGLRWDFRRDMALKIQLDAVRGSPTSIFPFRWENYRWDGRMNVVGVALDFVF